MEAKRWEKGNVDLEGCRTQQIVWRTWLLIMLHVDRGGVGIVSPAMWVSTR
jgi:hypothetical protein